MTTALAPNAIVAHRYEIRDPLAELPGYVEYRAFDLEVEVDISVWWLRRELFPSQDAGQQLIAAVQRMRDVRHANLRRLVDAGWENDGIYVTAQLASFDRVVPRVPSGGVLDGADLLHFATSVIDGLSAAHLNGQVHGRLVPSDIVHVARLIKVTGAGLWAGMDSQAAGPHWEPYRYFLAPEVIAGQPASVASDVFGAARVIADVAGGLDAIEANYKELAEALRAGCAADPAQRMHSVEELLDRLRGVLVDGRVPTNERAAVTPPADMELPVELSLPPPVDHPHADTAGFDAGTTMPDPPVQRRMKTRGSGANRKGPIDFSSLSLDDGEDVPRNRMVTRPIRKAPPSFEEGLETVAEDALVTGGPPPPGPTGLPEVAVETPTEIDAAAPIKAIKDKGSLPYKSMKPPSEKGAKPTPPMPVIDRPDMKPRLRAISSSVEQVPSKLGNYAPPRAMTARPAEAKRPWWLYAGTLLAAMAIGFLAVAIIVRMTRSSADEPDEPKPAITKTVDAGTDDKQPTGKPPVTANPAVRVIDAGPKRLRCPDGMVMMAGATTYCIDQYESPGRGRFPAAGVTLAQAQRSCERRQARLCTEAEWSRACRGRARASFPYGSTFMAPLCNIKGKKIRAAGSFSKCRSASGAYDMSGNVAEWVRGGIVKGGSAKDDSNGRCSAKQVPPGKGSQGFGDVGFRCCARP